MSAVKHSGSLGVPARRLAVALSAASPRADYRAVGFPLQSLTRTLPLLSTLLLLALSSCTNTDFRTKPIAEFLSGTWVVDSTNRVLDKSEHPRIQLLEFLPDKKVISHFFSIRHNKEYKNEVEYELTDSTFNYTDKFWVSGPFAAGYRLERLDEGRFRLVAKFPIARWSDPERDSIIWYSQVASAEDYLRPFMEAGKPIESRCPPAVMGLLHGYWKFDSTEYISHTAPEKHYYTFIDTSGTMYTLWLGNKPHRSTQEIRVKQDSIESVGNGTIPIKCLDRDHLVFEMPEEPGSYEAVFLSRIDPDTIIPDSLRVDGVELHTKSRP